MRRAEGAFADLAQHLGQFHQAVFSGQAVYDRDRAALPNKTRYNPAVMFKKLRGRLHIEPWERTLTILFIVQLMAGVGFSSIFPFLPLYVEDLGSSYGYSIELLAGLVFSAQAITMMIASPIWGGIADR